MEYLLSSKEMKTCDENTVEYYKVPGLVLMERAALGIVGRIEERFQAGSRILIVAGSGNNGGDALAAGRILMQRGYRVSFLVLGEHTHFSDSLKVQLDILKAYQCALFTTLRAVFDDYGQEKYDIIIDGLLGTGVCRPLTGTFEEAVKAVNESGAFVVSADIPSGIDADTGEVCNVAVKADLTVTFGFYKRGHYFYPGAEYTGELVCEEIGITQESFLGMTPGLVTYGERDIVRLPVRRYDGHKGTFGKLLLIAGSPGMCGACELCGKSAFRIGTGMVKIVTAQANREIMQRSLPEAMLVTYLEEAWQEAFQEQLKAASSWADCIAIGPGIGMDATARQLVEWALTKTSLPLVMDADALNLLGQNKAFKEALHGQAGKRKIILTPHPAEFYRIGGRKPEGMGRMEPVLALAREYGAVVVAKDARTLVAEPDGGCYLNRTGNSGMATAGSGDVLTGIIAGLLCQGMEAYEAAKLGVYIHGMAGDLAAARESEYSLMAGDLIEELKTVCRMRERMKGVLK